MFAQQFVPLGYEQITEVGTAIGLTVPDGATYCQIVSEAQDVRWRDDGTAPETGVGMPLAKGVTLEYSGTLSAIQFIEVSDGASLNVSYYRIAG